MSDKKTLRAEALARRAALLPDPDGARAAARLFLAAAPPAPDSVIAAYWPRADEFDTLPLIGRLLDGGFTVALPAIRDGTRVLDFTAWNGKTPLTQGRFGIARPAAGETVIPDIVIVPLLAFDARGHRLGYGGGYYDATLAALRAKHAVTAIGMGHDSQLAAVPLPAEDHDMRLDAAITPRLAYRFPMR